MLLVDKSKWRTPERQRKFFDDFANSRKFEPLDVKQWYSIRKKDLIRAVAYFLLESQCIELSFREEIRC
jgi:hypothetical protein